MNKQVAAIRSEQWRRIVCECINRDPNTSKRCWCRDNGVNYRSLMFWQRKFQMEALDQMSVAGNVLPAHAEHTSFPAFVDVTAKLKAVQDEQCSIPGDQEPVSLTPELMIQTGAYRIYINSSIHEDTLEKVMRVIRHA